MKKLIYIFLIFCFIIDPVFAKTTATEDLIPIPKVICRIKVRLLSDETKTWELIGSKNDNGGNELVCDDLVYKLNVDSGLYHRARVYSDGKWHEETPYKVYKCFCKIYTPVYTSFGNTSDPPEDTLDVGD